MGGLPPLTPALSPTINDDAVPLFFLDELAGIDGAIQSSSMGHAFSTGLPAYKKAFASAIRKPASSSSKLKKFVRFLDRVEIVPAPRAFYGSSESPNKKQKLSPTSSEGSFYTADSGSTDGSEPDEAPTPPLDLAPAVDPAIAAGLGRAGSPNRSPNQSVRELTEDQKPSQTSRSASGLLTPPRTVSPPPPPSWRIPPESLFGRQPHVRAPPRVRSPANADEEINLRADEHCPSPAESDEEVRTIRPGVSIIRSRSASPPTIPLHPVIARKMWPHGEVRFEDQWGRRLVPIAHKDAFQFDVWPVEEDALLEEGMGGGVQGAWVKGLRYRERYER